MRQSNQELRLGQIMTTYKNINKRNSVAKVLVICSTDGRLKVYYDERNKGKDRKIPFMPTFF